MKAHEIQQCKGLSDAIVSRSFEHHTATRGLLVTDHVILNHGQVTWTIPELAFPLLTTTPHQREDVSALERLSVHHCPTRRVFSGTGHELVTRQVTIRYLYPSATTVTPIMRENTPGVVRASHLSSPSTNLTRGLVARRLFKLSPCREGIILPKHLCILQDLNAGPTAQQLASLTTIPDGRRK
ncbi:uncharacterized protein TNCV_3906741 [Trichonephila clavipes]|nr:uncharacterized protein TNCV_3906741 [Trichonephila clavipes]